MVRSICVCEFVLFVCLLFFFKLGCSQGRAILRLLRFLGKLNLMGTKIVYMYRVVLSPRGEQYLDFSHMYRRCGHFLIFKK